MFGWLQPYLTELDWPHAEHTVRLMMATVLGGLIGLERELRDKPAGFRTIILICVGACVFSIASEVAGGIDYQRTRIAAQIVSGVGFLGAGAILRDRAGIMGMTTAATIWSVAAIGMAVGFGFLPLAILGTVVILVALLVFDVVERWIGDRRDIQDYHIQVENSEDAFNDIGVLFQEAKLDLRKRFCHQDGTSVVFHVVAMGAKANHDGLRMKILRSTDYTLRSA